MSPTAYAVRLAACIGLLGYWITYGTTAQPTTAVVAGCSAALLSLLTAALLTALVRDYDASEARYRANLTSATSEQPR
jgi:ABC-type proline/glycine betaine transport system permease subunit